MRYLLILTVKCEFAWGHWSLPPVWSALESRHSNFIKTNESLKHIYGINSVKFYRVNVYIFVECRRVEKVDHCSKRIPAQRHCFCLPMRCSNDTWTQGHTEDRWRSGKETRLSLPCSNLRSFGSKCTALKDVLVTLLVTFRCPPVMWCPHSYSAAGALCPSCSPRSPLHARYALFSVCCAFIRFPFTALSTVTHDEMVLL